MPLAPFTGELDPPPTVKPFEGELDTPEQAASFLDKLAGGRGTSVLYGAVSPAIAAAQMIGGEGTRKAIAGFEASRERGKKALDREGFDWYALGGSMLPASKIAGVVKGALPAANGVLGRMGVSAAQGGAIGAATPSPGISSDDYFPTKAMQAGTGGIVGGLTSGALDLTKSALRTLSPISDLFRGEQGVANLAKRGYEKNIGKDRLAEVRDALLQAKEIVPGDKPTAAEAVAGLPAGSPIQALQKMTAKTEGGPSAAFGERLMKQGAARDIAGNVRNVVTAPLREQALTLANAGKVQVADVVDGLQGIKQDPGLAASDVVSKSIGHLEDKLKSLADKDGVIDANALYTVRKELGNTISKFSQETQNWDKRLTGRIQGDIQKGIDWAMNNAIARAQGAPSVASGGQAGQRAIAGPVSQTASPTVWDQYLGEYAKRSQAIADSLSRSELAKKPIQPTSLAGSRDIATQSMPHVALLSRPVVMANALLSHVGKTNVEPKVDALNTQLLLNPNKLGAFLQAAHRKAPNRYQAIIQELMKQSGQSYPAATAQLFKGAQDE